MDLKEFLVNLIEDTRARADAEAHYSEKIFTELVCESLQDAGEIVDFISCEYRHRGMKIDGYGFVPDESTLDLFITEFYGESEIEHLTRAQLEKIFKRCETFFEKCLTDKFHHVLESSHPAHELALRIQQEHADVLRVRFFLLTDMAVSGRVKELPVRQVGNREWVYRIWDLDRLSKLMATGEPEEIVIDFMELFGRPLQCLPAGDRNGDLRSYLTVIPGDWLAKIYGQYSARLLEQNVRTFLQLKGGVNKGIRNTILKEPHFFFPYNNGISATAEEAEVRMTAGVAEITALRNLQIVNGGQTTASIYNVLKRDRSDGVEQVRVQMKLTIVPSDMVGELVPKISRFANSQNKISDADFFSNHPFHTRLETFSRKLWAPPTPGSQLQTHWFYERARGQYANAQTYLTPSLKKQFAAQHPRSQLIVKTDLAKVHNTFRLLPHIVSRGAQKNFAAFAEWVSGRWEADNAEFNELWYQTAVAQTLVFRRAEKIVLQAEWYAQGYRANTVTYGIALLVHRLDTSKRTLDLRKIWQRQILSQSMEDQLLIVCAAVQRRLLAAPSLFGVSNISEWAKKQSCWDDVRLIDFEILSSFAGDLIQSEEVKAERFSARREQKLLSEAEAQIQVTSLGREHWLRVRSWGASERRVGPTDRSLLDLACSAQVPSAKQAVRLLAIHELYHKEHDSS